MLQHNTTARTAPGTARKAHAAHAAVVGGHIFCCGAPAVLALFAAGAGASIGLAAVQRFFQDTHAYLHAHEIWILVLSAILVVAGGWLEWRARHGRRLSLFFAASVLCFALNAGVTFTHRDGEARAYSIQANR